MPELAEAAAAATTQCTPALAATTPAVARLNSVEDVMERLKLGRSKVYEELGSGRLRSIKVGRRRLVSEAAIVDFINHLEAGGPA
ncbi:MAG: helix-turn-helix domain-containing protein [Mycobacterium sp.]|uniref:helix-turn-helix domain-containing protein n=1 Tax=Mycobacterium sp. TaxID=1785 RepID=UPI003F97733A